MRSMFGNIGLTPFGGAPKNPQQFARIGDDLYENFAL